MNQMTFTIKKGQHGCKHPFIDHQATVSETRLITLDDWFTGAQPKFINKIWGYSFGHHQIDSARLGLNASFAPDRIGETLIELKFPL